MLLNQKYIIINPCPICSKSHKYQVIVKRATALSVSEKEANLIRRKFTRLFTCPITYNDFQADIILQDNPNEIIVLFKIGEIISENVKNE